MHPPMHPPTHPCIHPCIHPCTHASTHAYALTLHSVSRTAAHAFTHCIHACMCTHAPCPRSHCSTCSSSSTSSASRRGSPGTPSACEEAGADGWGTAYAWGGRVVQELRLHGRDVCAVGRMWVGQGPCNQDALKRRDLVTRMHCNAGTM